MGAPDLPREGAAASRLREGGSERPGGKGHCRPPSESRTFLSLFRAAQARGDGARPASEPLLRCRVLRARPSCHQRGGGGGAGQRALCPLHRHSGSGHASVTPSSGGQAEPQGARGPRSRTDGRGRDARVNRRDGCPWSPGPLGHPAVFPSCPLGRFPQGRRRCCLTFQAPVPPGPRL